MRLRVVDSHTEGEPTRVVVAGGPELAGGTVAERAESLVRDHDDLRRGLVLEPPTAPFLLRVRWTSPSASRYSTGWTSPSL